MKSSNIAKGLLDDEQQVEADISKTAHHMEQTMTNLLALLPISLLTTSRSLNELFLSLLPEFTAKSLDDNDLKLLAVFSEAYLTGKKNTRLKLTDEDLLAQLQKLGGEDLCYALEGLKLLAKSNKVKTLAELDELLQQKNRTLLAKLPLSTCGSNYDTLELPLNDKVLLSESK
jgi:hypothetical protein